MDRHASREEQRIFASIEEVNTKIDILPIVPKNTAVIFGDSITNQNGPGDDIPSFGSVTYALNSYGYFAWANVLLGQRLKLLYNAGISSNTTDMMLARIQKDVLKYKPGYCIIMAGINDIRLLNLSVSYIKNNLLTMYKMLIANGIQVVACTITPSTGIPLAQYQKTIEINNYIRSLVSELKNYTVCDWYEDLVDPATDLPLTGYTQEGLHPAPQGAYKMGYKLYNVLDKLLAKLNLFSGSNLHDTKNPLPNPYGLGGTTLAPSWEFATTAAHVNTKIARENGLTWQQAENQDIVATIMTFAVASTTGFTIGQKVSAYIEYEIDESATSIDSFYGQLVALNTNSMLAQSYGLFIDPTSLMRFYNTPTKGIIYIPRFTIPANCNKLQLKFTAKLVGKFRLGRTRTILE